MKFTLTINDASASDLEKLFAALNGSTAMPQPTGMPSGTPLAPEQGANQIPAGSSQSYNTDTGEDDDESDTVDGSSSEVDSTGLPWDERIHSKNKSQNKDGSWRGRKGVDDQTIEAVEAELRARGNSTPVPQQPSQPQPMGMPSGDNATPAGGVTMPQMPQPTMTQEAAPQIPTHTMPTMPTNDTSGTAAPNVPTDAGTLGPAAMAASQSAPTNVDFQGFMQQLSRKMQERDATGNPLVDQNYLVSLTQKVGQMSGKQIAAITDIMGDPNMINVAVQIMSADGKW